MSSLLLSLLLAFPPVAASQQQAQLPQSAPNLPFVGPMSLAQQQLWAQAALVSRQVGPSDGPPGPDSSTSAYSQLQFDNFNNPSTTNLNALSGGFQNQQVAPNQNQNGQNYIQNSNSQQQQQQQQEQYGGLQQSQSMLPPPGTYGYVGPYPSYGPMASDPNGAIQQGQLGNTNNQGTNINQGNLNLNGPGSLNSPINAQPYIQAQPILPPQYPGNGPDGTSPGQVVYGPLQSDTGPNSNSLNSPGKTLNPLSNSQEGETTSSSSSSESHSDHNKHHHNKHNSEKKDSLRTWAGCFRWTWTLFLAVCPSWILIVAAFAGGCCWESYLMYAYEANLLLQAENPNLVVTTPSARRSALRVHSQLNSSRTAYNTHAISSLSHSQQLQVSNLVAQTHYHGKKKEANTNTKDAEDAGDNESRSARARLGHCAGQPSQYLKFTESEQGSGMGSPEDMGPGGTSSSYRLSNCRNLMTNKLHPNQSASARNHNSSSLINSASPGRSPHSARGGGSISARDEQRALSSKWGKYINNKLWGSGGAFKGDSFQIHSGPASEAGNLSLNKSNDNVTVNGGNTNYSNRSRSQSRVGSQSPSPTGRKLRESFENSNFEEESLLLSSPNSSPQGRQPKRYLKGGSNNGERM